MFPTASIIILQFGEATFGTVIASEPSFGVLATKVVNVAPLSLENKMFTLEVLIPFAVVPATFHVMVCEEPCVQVTSAVAGEVTLNGPVLANVTTMVPRLVCPPFGAALSRTVTAKFIVLAAFGTTSHVGVRLPANTSANRGI